jgi:hypothetical protein
VIISLNSGIHLATWVAARAHTGTATTCSQARLVPFLRIIPESLCGRNFDSGRPFFEHDRSSAHGGGLGNITTYSCFFLHLVTFIAAGGAASGGAEFPLKVTVRYKTVLLNSPDSGRVEAIYHYHKHVNLGKSHREVWLADWLFHWQTAQPLCCPHHLAFVKPARPGGTHNSDQTHRALNLA